MTHRKAHSGYLSGSNGEDLTGRSDLIGRYRDAKDGSARLLDALLRYYERRKAA